jgi:Predicted pyridoxal phosphate-dependent enzyme apparently involved in regulation of cell wall biogenesis
LIDLIDLKLRYKEEKKDLKVIIDNILKNAHFVLTEEVSEFEKSIAKYTNTKYCLGLNSGTDALMMSLMVSGIKKGDEVITTPISFIATLGALIILGRVQFL